MECGVTQEAHLLLISVELASSSRELPGEVGKGSHYTPSDEQVSRMVGPSASPSPHPPPPEISQHRSFCQRGLR